MSFLDFFKNTNKNDEKVLSKLHYDLEDFLGEQEEHEHIKTSCYAGLLARLAKVDFKVSESEHDFMIMALMKFSKVDQKSATAIVEVALKNIDELGGLENHLYVHPLRDLMTKEEKFNLLTSLFALAASDGVVENNESEEIRLVCKGLDLSHEHFIASRATVVQSLGALR